MRLKDGFQVCQHCGGGGCYWCRRQGWQAQCPVCGSSEPELIERKTDEEFSCHACESIFSKDGRVLQMPKPSQTPNKTQKSAADSSKSYGFKKQL